MTNVHGWYFTAYSLFCCSWLISCQMQEPVDSKVKKASESVEAASVLVAPDAQFNQTYAEKMRNFDFVAHFRVRTSIHSGRQCQVLWDQGNYANCGQYNCRQGYLLPAAAVQINNDEQEQYFSCVINRETGGTEFKATAYLSWNPADNSTLCLDPSSSAAQNAGYWRDGNYVKCQNNQVVCLSGTKELVTSIYKTGDGHINYAKACILVNNPRVSKFVASIYSHTDSKGQDLCITALDERTRRAGYFDQHYYGSCQNNMPKCKDGSQKVLMEATELPDGTRKFHSVCLLNNQKRSGAYVASISSENAQGVDMQCQVQNFDSQTEFGLCTSDKMSLCRYEAHKVVTSMYQDAAGKVHYHSACFLNYTITDENYNVNEFSDKGTILIFAHQDDDVIWMLPFFPYAQRFHLSAYPYHQTYSQVLAAYPAYVRANYVPTWGEVASNQQFGVYFDKCERKGIVTEAALEAKLRPLISNLQVRRIVTHNNWGEYGHCQHRLVNQVVRKLAVEMKKDVWALSIKIKDINVPAITPLGSMGLPSVQGAFHHQFFSGFREEYRTRFFPAEIGNQIDLWTFFEGVYEYPYGQQTFIKLVDAGKDLTQVYASFRQLEQEIPVQGDCSGQ